MSHLRFPKDFATARSELLGLLRGLLLGPPKVPMLVFPGYPRESENEMKEATLTRSDSQFSNVSDYLDVERSKSLHSALKKCTRTAEEKKVVSFADSMGLDLCHVRPIFPHNSSDEDFFGSTPPIVYPITKKSNPSAPPPPHVGSFNSARYLHMHTTQFPNFTNYAQIQKEINNRARKRCVCLKSSNVIGMTFSGIIAVNNLDFHKKVHVRYTLDDWRSSTDIPAHYTNSLSHERIDHFAFSIFLPPTIPVGSKCQFCIRYEVAGQEYWDNNDGKNYILECRTMADNYCDLIAKDSEQPRFY